MLAVGGRIRAAREEAGLTDTALAERLGLSATTVYLWESGMLHPSTRLQDIADATGKELAWFGADPAGDSALAAAAAPEPSVESVLDEPNGARPGGAAAEPEEESEPLEPLEPVAAEEARGTEPERAPSERWAGRLTRAAEERELDVAPRTAELEAQAGSLAEEREAVAQERAQLAEQERALANRSTELAAAAEERDPALEARTAELEARAAALAEERQALARESEREAELVRTAEQREQDLVARVGELEAQAAALTEERETLARDRAHLLEEERSLAERAAKLARKAAEREQALAARAAELEAFSARLEEQKRALSDWETDIVRAAEERKQDLAARASELEAQSATLAAEREHLTEEERALDAQAARLDEHSAALAQEQRAQRPFHTKPTVPPDDDAGQQPIVDRHEKPPAPQGIGTPGIVQRPNARVDLSAFPNIASGYEIGGRSIVARLVDGRCVRITAKQDSASGAFVSKYEVAEPGSLAWIPAPEYQTYASETLADLLLGALREVDSGPRTRKSEPDGGGHSLSGDAVADEPAQPDPALEPESAVPQGPTRRRAWRRGRRR
jgi:transcriptional regulator with XRE-family HTH domain